MQYVIIFNAFANQSWLISEKGQDPTLIRVTLSRYGQPPPQTMQKS